MPPRVNQYWKAESANRVVIWFGATALISAVILICNIDLLLGRSAPIWDAVSQFCPWFSLVADHARHGRLLLWDPWIDAGSPDFAEPESGAASPITILFGLIFRNPFKGFIAYWLASWIFGGIGMLVLAKHLRAPWWGALVVSMAFAANGFYVGHGEHTSMVYAYSFMPWILWRFDTGLNTRRPLDFCQAGALWGLGALGGYPQLTILEAFFVGFWIVGFLFINPPPREDVKKRIQFGIVAFATFGLVGVAIMSPTYLAFALESRGYSARANALPRDFALTSNLLPPGALKSFASPIIYLLQLPPTVLWKDTDVSMVDFYMGAVLCVLAVSAVVFFSKRALWLAFVGLAFLSCAVGRYLPVRGWLYDLVPPTRFFRHPSLFSAFTMIALAVLAAIGTSELQSIENEERGGWRRLAPLIVAITLGLVATRSYKLLEAGSHTSYPEVHFWIVWLGMPVILGLWYTRKLHSQDMHWAIVILALFDAVSVLTLSAPTLSSSGSLAWWNVMQTKHKTELTLGAAGLDRHLHPPADLADNYAHDRNVAIKDPEFANLTALTSPVFQAYTEDPQLNHIALGPNRMWFSDSPVWCQPTQASFDKFKAFVDANGGSSPLVLHSRESMMSEFGANAVSTRKSEDDCSLTSSWIGTATAEVVRYSPDRLTLSYYSNKKGWLLITDRWGRSWQALVNGKPTPVFGADFIFRAVHVNVGTNSIVMHYSMSGYVPLVILSWGTLSSIGIWSLLTASRQTGSVVRRRDGHVNVTTEKA